MKPTIKYTTFSEINQIKLFHYYSFDIPKDDPVLELINILEGLDLTNFKKLFQYKTKINPIRLLAVIIYAYSMKITSLREIERNCNENIKFKHLLNGASSPDYTTISKFMKKCESVLDDIFNQFNRKILEKQGINTDNIFIDGTKIEAYANKYTFVWKKAALRNKEKLNIQIYELLSNFNSTYNKNVSKIEDIITFLSDKDILFVKGKGKRRSIEQKLLEQALSFFEKNSEYEKHLKIMSDRNNYSKTDTDATFMRMKEDYMRNGQLKPGYNLQIAVSSELIVGFEIFSNPTDVKTLIPFLNVLSNNGIKLNNIVADAGYESLENYLFLEKNNLNSYIKPQNFEKSKTKKYMNDLNRVENLIYYEDDNLLIRKDGILLEYLYDIKKNGLDFKVFMNNENGKIVYYNHRFRKLSNNSRDNINTDLGKQLRLNRSIQVEGAFAAIKEDMNLRKLKVRGKQSVKRELSFLIMGYNFKIHMNKKRRKNMVTYYIKFLNYF